MGRIITWTLTEEHRKQIPAWNERWIQTIMSTEAMTEEDRAIVRGAINGMYDAAKLARPNAIVFVRGPIEGAIVAGAAAAWWHAKKNGMLVARDATDAATSAATYTATRDATNAATYTATRDATRDATAAATNAATNRATSNTNDTRTWDATARATAQATDGATDDATRAALYDVGDNNFARQCIAAATNMRNGGNEWASWCCYLSFVRDVVGFTDESHAAYKHYEDCAIHSGWRYMHSEFVIVCDRPLRRVTRTVGGRYQLHCEDGPAIEWCDGNVAWYIEGLRVDRQIVMAPETQTVAQIDAEQNADVKEIRIRRFGWPRYLQESGARVVDSRICEVTNTTEALMETKDGNRRLMVTCPTRRRFAPGVPREIKTCEEAQRWLAGPFGQARVVART